MDKHQHLLCKCGQIQPGPGAGGAVGSHRVGHDWRDLAAVAAAVCIYESYSLNSSYPPLPPLCPQVCFYICISIPALQIGSSVPFL